ncbi:uncharacterized protein K452DRAFT_290046, partial [Aplosporella prunicola CBS 121167]
MGVRGTPQPRGGIIANILTKPTRACYSESFGTEINSIKGKRRWSLKGFALELWHKKILPRSDRIVENEKPEIYRNCNVRDTFMARHCWMVGPDEQHAHPTIVVVSESKIVLRRTMRMLAKDNKIEEDGFKVMGVKTSDVRELAGEAEFTAVLV